MLFQQTAAPTGWTKQTTHNNKALRVVSGTAGYAGSYPFSTVFAKTATDYRSLTVANLASHRHSIDANGGDGSGTRVDRASNSGSTYISNTNYAGSNSAHTHPMDIRVQYVDLIIASKD
jgi:hypothetical protein